MRELAVLAEQKAEEEKKKHEAAQTQSAEIRTRFGSAEEGAGRSASGAGGQGGRDPTQKRLPWRRPLELLKIIRSAITSAVGQAAQRRAAIRPIPGSLEDDLQVLKDIDKIRLNAIDVIQRFL